MTLYWGIDPTGDSMHVGHLLGVMVAKRFLAAGHSVIVLVGGGTSMIGDPSGKNEERPVLPKETIEENKRKLKKIIEKLLGVAEGKVTMVDNADWLEKVSLIDFLREVGKYMPISAMLDKEMVKTRLDQGISYAEFSYQLLQAYDHLVLFNEKGCNLQIGGSDQWGNIVTGVDLIRKKTGKTAHAFSFPLIVDPKTGRKFGKSEKGASIWLEAHKTHPFLLYQFFINASDELITTLVDYFSFKSLSEIKRLKKEWSQNKEARLLQKELAYELVTVAHGEKVANECIKVAGILFDRNSGSLSLEDLDFVKGALPTMKVNKDDLKLENALLEMELVGSKGEANRLIKQNGVHSEKLFGKYVLVRKGKKEYGLVELT